MFSFSPQARQLAVTEDSRLLFHPSGSAIQASSVLCSHSNLLWSTTRGRLVETSSGNFVQVFHTADGRQHTVLRGAHFESINCCTWNGSQQVQIGVGVLLQLEVLLRCMKRMPKYP